MGLNVYARTPLPGPHTPVSPGVRACFDHATRRYPNQAWRGTALPSRPRADLMPAHRQILNHVLRSAVVKLQIARIHRVIIEARYQMPRLEPGRFDRLLRV